jgi:hypothetical protein
MLYGVYSFNNINISYTEMAELSLEEKCKAAAKLIEQSPPGEVK